MWVCFTKTVYVWLVTCTEIIQLTGTKEFHETEGTTIEVEGKYSYATATICKGTIFHQKIVQVEKQTCDWS